ncbi:DNA helicase UvrC [Eggerthellaceae bacterium zg-1084]|uniref:DNA helicase UvrC n=1 Tax=Berryella wangjianweii TaxID=2734634 RepID=A0A6M8IX22_9ACTN|nr:Veg family protein [Berryella wangjianweii]NPD30660.1 DNA helicase UvrC [Berryella wangjianweii]QKF07305.1 DNA helicase UvrC [Berryella wangjianweii]
MNLEQQAQIVDSIHDTLGGYVGQRLKVRANMGRSKIVENEGVLTQVHPRLFIMEVDRKRGRTARQSYQYVDVLTGTVELSQNGESLFEPFMADQTEASATPAATPTAAAPAAATTEPPAGDDGDKSEGGDA